MGENAMGAQREFHYSVQPLFMPTDSYQLLAGSSPGLLLDPED
jgi:hypothetical protein